MGLELNREPMLSDDSWLKKLKELYSDSLAHYGVAYDENPPGRGSGRYPHGSGDRILQHSYDIYSRVQKLRKSGVPNVEIAKSMGFYKTYPNSDTPILDKNGEPQGNTTILRARMSLAKDYIRNDKVMKAKDLREAIDPDTGKFYTHKKIGELLSTDGDIIGESTVRNWFTNEQAEKNSKKTMEAVEALKNRVDSSNSYIDVGRGVELGLQISPDKMKTALSVLKDEGYEVLTVKIPNQSAGNGYFTTMKVLCPPGTTPKDVHDNKDNIKLFQEDVVESLTTRLGIRDPVQVDMSRIKIRYAEDGGTLKDGVIEIRARRDENGNLVPAAEDLSLGNSEKYAQVRIAVENNKYIKGMAVYNTEMDPKYDIIVNSNKSIKDGPDEALKSYKKDKDGNIIFDNPFGTTVWQSEYAPGKLSAVNIVSDIWGKDRHVEGSWDDWSKNLPAQFLAKQSEDLIRQQLQLKIKEKEQEYDEIMSLNNPVVKKQMLKDFGESCDAAAVDLKAASLPNQRVQVLLPLTTIKENEVYNPNYPDGTTLALVRFPHTGPFEIPIVKVNNNVKEAKSFLEDNRGQAKDVIGVNPKTASILSGADFDGDTAIVIPMTRQNSQGEFEKTVNIKGIGNGQHQLPGLVGFNPSAEYPARDGMKVMTKRAKGIEMGVVSNLITDMSLKGGVTDEELERAVKYSMVVIDAEKHKLDYTKAEKDYRIQELKDKYQVNADGKHGVSTLLSRAKSEERVALRQLNYSIDPDTGEKVYKLKSDRFYPETVKVKKLASEEYKAKHPNAKYERDEDGNFVYETYPNGKPVLAKTGKINQRETKSTKMAEVKDAYELLSDNPSNKEILYADFANKMKALGNESRKSYLTVPNLEYSPEARKEYAAEVASLNDKLNRAKMNAPKERVAQALATQIVNEAKQNNPDMDKDDLKRLRGQAVIAARQRTGAQKDRVTFTEREWEAINKGAITNYKLEEILKNADSNQYKALATPRKSKVSAATANRIQALLKAGWTRVEIEKAGYASMDTIKAVENGNYEKESTQ